MQLFSDLRSSLRLAFRDDDPFLSAPRPTWAYPRWAYLRLLGVGFASGFLSFSTQVRGLIGEEGILPARELLAESHGWRGLLSHPSLFRLDSSDSTLSVACLVGVVLGACVVLNLWPRLTLALATLLYASLASVSREFSGFQSEGLLVEMGLVGAYLAPRGLRPGLGARSPAPRAVIWLVRFLCFRLWFEAGIAKLSSSDPSWLGLTALDSYYENAPFPTWIGWWVQHLPRPFHALSTLATLAIESLGPVALLVGGKPRRIAVALWTLLHVLVLSTANYTYLNYSAIALGLTFLDDSDFRRMLPLPALVETRPAPRPRRLIAVVAIPLAISTYGSSLLMLATFGFPVASLPRPVLAPLVLARGFRASNRFALFQGMTEKREHIEFEGTDDGGATWRTYRFRWQPQALDEPPHFMAPHLPRFDWNLWFAANSRWQDYPLVHRTGVRLMEGSGAVRALFASDPFPERPPDMIRFPLYRYRFTSVRELRETGNYWKRERVGYYAPLLYRDPRGAIRVAPDAPLENEAQGF
jgi:uncharacterized membrane protein YphA (DoxX/SURF4 family)